MRLRTRLWRSLLGLSILGLCASSWADETPVQAKWQVQEIKYSYVGFTTAYNCDAAASKIKAILVALGAHPDTRVNATGCPLSRPAKNFFITVTAVTPVPADQAVETAGEKSRQELLQRLGVKQNFTDQFPATWKSVDLAKERRLDIRPGDCELIEGLRDRVLPKLSLKIEEDRVSCTPNQLSSHSPQLRVSALVAMKSPDAQ